MFSCMVLLVYFTCQPTPRGLKCHHWVAKCWQRISPGFAVFRVKLTLEHVLFALLVLTEAPLLVCSNSPHAPGVAPPEACQVSVVETGARSQVWLSLGSSFPNTTLLGIPKFTVQDPCVHFIFVRSTSGSQTLISLHDPAWEPLK